MDTDKMRDCPVMATIEVIGGKWKPRILWRLRDGPATFGDLRRYVGVSEKVLSENLAALQRDGIVSRQPLKEGDMVYVEYGYTCYGRSLVPVLDAMGGWGLGHDARKSERSDSDLDDIRRVS
ncbi:DNA-binding HxlR family transcriptional regulator [Peteryoungia aggregata LMG 23059]|uniref:DNA-binding HxlR family transcriptional regulator n=1 Tax=Peteryoungia aggregata LMG 23059 TaxID=1368425 RepID=A0ABU0G4E8_9HYPH|nr:helix-turn-helix domain-containing protein [Peteryoungia aggregata]MDQ0420211.1 DNA-binding HxlR family transcriptional regulator [Peteryoungia aggregata LMG 23059]